MKNDLEKLDELAGAASPGEWILCRHLESEDADRACPCGYRGGIYGPDGEHLVCEMGSTQTAGEDGLEAPRYERRQEIANAHFIAAIRSAYPALAAEIRSLRAHAEAFVEALENQDYDTWERLGEALAAYRADFPEDRP